MREKGEEKERGKRKGRTYEGLGINYFITATLMMTSCRHTWHHGRKISHFQSGCCSEFLLGVVLLEVVKNICCVKRSHRVVDYLDERNCDSRERGGRGRE